MIFLCVAITLLVALPKRVKFAATDRASGCIFIHATCDWLVIESERKTEHSIIVSKSDACSNIWLQLWKPHIPVCSSSGTHMHTHALLSNVPAEGANEPVHKRYQAAAKEVRNEVLSTW